MIWKRFLITISFLISSLVLMSCGWGPYFDDSRVQIFDASVGISKNLYPFFFAQAHLNRNFSMPDMSKYTIPQENISEWRTMVDGSFSDNEIIELVYRTSLDTLYIMKKEQKSFGNDFAKSIIQNGQNNLFNYISFARKVEKALPSFFDYWEDETDYKDLKKYYKIAKKFALNYNDKKIEQRYAYQAIVIARYLSKFDEAIELYDKTFAKIDKNNESILKYWALSHVAYCQYTLDENENMMLNYLTVFYNSTAKNVWIYQNLSVKILRNIKDKFTDEQNYAYLVLSELHNPGKSLSFLKEIAKLDPNHQLFRLLINREVNKLEEWLLTKDFSDYGPVIAYDDNNLSNDKNYAQKMIVFMEQVLPKLDSKNKVHAELVLAHLNFLVNNLSKAEQYIHLTENHVTSKIEKEQLSIEKIIVKSAQAEECTAELAEFIYTELQNLEYKNKEYIQASKVFQSMIQAEYRIFHHKKQYEIAALFMAFATSDDLRFWQTWWNFDDPFLYLDKYASSKQVKNFMGITETLNKNKLESYLLKNYTFDKYRFLDLLGTIELRQDNLEEAHLFYKAIPEKFWETEYSYQYYLNTNPFSNVFLPKYMREDFVDKKYICKKFFVEELIRLKNDYKTAQNDQKAEIAIKIGNAYQNMSYFGSNWLYVCYGKSIYGGRLLWTAYNTYVNENYKTCSEALKYYDVAIKTAENEEIKSQAYFLAATTFANVESFGGKSYDGDYYQSGYWDTENKHKRKNLYVEQFKKYSPEMFDLYLSNCEF